MQTTPIEISWTESDLDDDNMTTTEVSNWYTADGQPTEEEEGNEE